MISDLRVCFVGLGSIGRRHLQDLHEVAKERRLRLTVDALRHSELTLDQEISSLVSRQYSSQDELGDYDAIFVCNPSRLHYRTLCELKNKAKYFFVEKPVFVKPLSDAELEPFAATDRFYVACPLRHTAMFHRIQDFVANQKVLSARVMCSSYLPNWRPGTDYRSVYSAQRQNGGVKLDLIHEFDYVFTLFGFPESEHFFECKVSALEIDANDVVSYIARYKDKTIEIHLDYFGRIPQRYIELYTDDTVVRFDFIGSAVANLCSGNIEKVGDSRNAFQKQEIRYFVDFMMNGYSNINSVLHANDVLRHIC